MGKNTLFAIFSLAVVWLVLRENFTLPEAAAGIAAGACSVFFCRRFLPVSKSADIRLLRLAAYPFYLIAQVYAAGFKTIAIILKGADADIVEVKTKLASPLLRALLAGSITLVPGSISLDLNEDTITVLRLRGKADISPDAESAGARLKGKLEDMLLKAERREKPCT